MIYKIEEAKDFVIKGKKNLDGTYSINICLTMMEETGDGYYLTGGDISRGIINIDCLDNIERDW